MAENLASLPLTNDIAKLLFKIGSIFTTKANAHFAIERLLFHSDFGHRHGHMKLLATKILAYETVQHLSFFQQYLQFKKEEVVRMKN